VSLSRLGTATGAARAGLWVGDNSAMRVFRRRAGGQAMVMTLIFAVVMVVVALSLYRVGRLTTDKMALQNAADAMAYSASVMEARDLNFASYMNRAIIANEVAVGQSVGLASWAFHWNSIGEWLLEYNKYLSGPTSGFSDSFLQPASAVFTVTGSRLPVSFVPLMSAYARGLSAINHYTNQAYGIATQIHHVTTIAAVVGVMDEIRDDTAPDDATISDFGLMSLVTHLVTYTTDFTRMYNPKRYVAVSDFQDDLTGETDAGGYGRLAAMIHNSGDPFTKGWHNPQYGADDSLNGRGWNFRLFEQMADNGFLPFLPFSTPFVFPGLPVPGILTADVNDAGNIFFNFYSGFDATIDFGVASVEAGYDFELEFQFGIGMERQGSSEIRMIAPLTGSHSGEAAGEIFNWSSADATRAYINIGASMDMYAYARANIALVGSFGVEGGAGGELYVDGENEGLDFNLYLVLRLGLGPLGSIDVFDIDLPLCSVDTCPFPASLPLGTAFTQASKTGNAIRSVPGQMGTEKLGTGPVPPDAYGGAANTILPWNYPPSPVVGGGYSGTASGVFFQPDQLTPRRRNVGTSYGGLPYYVDTTDTESLFGSGGPYLLMGLALAEDDHREALYESNPGAEPTGRFSLFDEFADASMNVVAKSEVYFKRPLDLDGFARGDGYVEHGSAFNPYWNARLVDTSHADRVAALLVDQKVVAQDGVSTLLLDAVDALWTWIEGLLPTDSELIPR